MVREQLLSFLAEGVERSDSDEGYPLYVEKEYRDFIGCGDLSAALRAYAARPVATNSFPPFSCKNRGICPSCTTRRMSDEAAYLADMVLPEAPYRQWTLTFPWTMRYLMAKDRFYGMRPAFSHQRLSFTEEGKVLYTVRGLGYYVGLDKTPF